MIFSHVRTSSEPTWQNMLLARVRVTVAIILNLRQKKIEINWSEKIYNQQNVKNTT